MAVTWHQTEYPGVRYYDHPTRKHGSTKKDRYFTIRYRVNGKQYENGLGWSSEGMTARDASIQLAKLREAKMKGEGATTLTEKRQVEKSRKAEETKRLADDERNSLTVTQLSVDYLAWSRANKKSWQYDEWRLGKHILPRIGERPISSIKAADIESLKVQYMEEGQSPATICQALALLRGMFNFAILHGNLAGQNPVKGVKFPRLDNQRTRFLSYQEAETLLAKARETGPDLHDICAISLYTGMRKGEIEKLTWQDVDLENGIIHIRDAKAGDRKAFISDTLKEIVEARTTGAKSGLVFPGIKSGKRRTNTSKEFDRVVRALGWNDGVSDSRQKIVFHTLRHTFGSWLAQQGETLLTIKELMGHKTIQMTMRYAHLIPDQKINAVQKLGKRAAGGKVIAMTPRKKALGEE